MSYIGTIKRLYRNLRDGLRWAHKACRASDFIVREILDSNASDELKAQAEAFQTAANALCAAIQAYIDSLNE